MKRLLVTGSSGLIGSEVCSYFAREFGYAVHGVDNNQRSVFFGPEADTRWNQRRLARDVPGFVHHEMDIRDRAGVSISSGSCVPRRSFMPRASLPTIARRRFRLTTSKRTPSALSTFSRPPGRHARRLPSST